jgi:hypothetical protein
LSPPNTFEAERTVFSGEQANGGREKKGIERVERNQRENRRQQTGLNSPVHQQQPVLVPLQPEQGRLQVLLSSGY